MFIYNYIVVKELFEILLSKKHKTHIQLSDVLESQKAEAAYTKNKQLPVITALPANLRPWPNVGLLLGLHDRAARIKQSNTIEVLSQRCEIRQSKFIVKAKILY